MLRYLEIEDYALIESLSVEFTEGLTTVTGETGAGKSILMGALGLALGGRASAASIRKGAARARIQAVFDRPEQMLADIALEDDGELILCREILKDGRSRSTVCGALVTVKQLRQLGETLADLHGQGDQQSLFYPSWQRQYLDGVGDLASLVGEVGALVAKLKAVEEERERLRSAMKAESERSAFRAFQIAELSDAALSLEEEKLLSDRRRLLASREKAAALAAEIESAQKGEGSVSGFEELLERLHHACERLGKFHETFAHHAEAFAGEIARLSDLDADLARLREEIEFTPDEYDRVERRLLQISELKRKYRTDVKGLLSKLEELQGERERMVGAEQEIERLDSAYQDLLDRATRLALDVRAKRRRAASRLERECRGLLAELAMPQARIHPEIILLPVDKGIRIETPEGAAGLTATGIDQVELKAVLNPGEAALPLRRFASGGERSRLMLALRLLATKGSLPMTVVFDEIDDGISGEAAISVGRKLRDLGRERQVLCITHLPQVAAEGTQQIEVTKTVREDRAKVAAVPVAGEERVLAISRLLAGRKAGEAALRHAKELLENASSR